MCCCLTLFLPGPLTNLPSGAYLPPPPRNSAVKRKKGDVREKGGNKVFGKQRVLQQPQVLWKQFRNNLLPAQLLSAQPAAHPVWPPGCSLPESQPPPTFQISDGRELVRGFRGLPQPLTSKSFLSPLTSWEGGWAEDFVTLRLKTPIVGCANTEI